MRTANASSSREFASRDSRLFHLDALTLKVDTLGSSSFSSRLLHGNCFGSRRAVWQTDTSIAWPCLEKECKPYGRGWQRVDPSQSACAWRKNICYLSQLTHLLLLPLCKALG